MMITKIPDEIINSLNKGKLALFIGHDLDSEEYGIPSLATLAGNIVRRVEGWQRCPLCSEEQGCIRPTRCLVPFLQAATLYKQKELSSIIPLVDLLHEQLHIQRVPSKLFELIAQLPLKIIVTTAYDQRLQDALRATNKQYHQTSTDLQIIARESAETQIIHLYGVLSEPDSLILTEADHVSLQDRKRLVCIWLQGLLATHTCLFIDVDFGNPYLQMLYSPIIQKLGALRRHPYVVITNPHRLPTIDVAFHKLDISPLELLQALKKHVNYKPVLRPSLPMPPSPYKFLDHFRAEDRAIFVGRDSEIHELKNRILTRNLTILFAYSGMGKTSLLQAGVIPELEAEGFLARYLRLGDDPIGLLHNLVDRQSNAESKPVTTIDEDTEVVQVFIIDQAEELFTLHTGETRLEFANLLASYVNNLVLREHFVLSLRTEYLGQLQDLFIGLGHPDILDNRFRLGLLKPEDARYAIEKPATLFNFVVEGKLTEAILNDLAGSGYDPSQLQIVSYQLYEDAHSAKSGGSLTLSYSRYQALGEARGILAGFLDRTLEKIGTKETKTNLETILKNMITFERTKAGLSWEDIARRVEYASLTPEEVRNTLQVLQQNRIVRRLEGGEYELVHDVLVKSIWAWLDETDISRLNAVQSLRHAINEFRQLHRLMVEDKLIAVQQAANALTFTIEELIVLLLSSLSAVRFGQPGYWVRRIKTYNQNFLPRDIQHLTSAERQFLDKIEDKLAALFNLEELRTFTFIELGMDDSSWWGEGPTITEEVKKLITAAYQNGQIGEVIDACRRQLPAIRWDDILAEIQDFPSFSLEESSEIQNLSGPLNILGQIQELNLSHLHDYPWRAEVLLSPPYMVRELFWIMRSHFNLPEIREVALYLGVDIDQFKTSDKLSLIRELIRYFTQFGRIDFLYGTLIMFRPHITLLKTKFNIEPPSPSEEFELFKLLQNHFDRNELENLIRHFRIKPESLTFGHKGALSYQLVVFMKRQNRLDHLRLMLAYWRPTVGLDVAIEAGRILLATYDAEQLRTLCFDLAVNYDELGFHKSELAEGLSDYMRQHGRMGELIDAIIFPDQVGQGRFEVSLRRILVERLDSKRFEMLCGDLRTIPDEFAGDQLDAKVRELIMYATRQNILSVLLYQITQDWNDILSKDEAWELIRPSATAHGFTLTFLQKILGESGNNNISDVYDKEAIPYSTSEMFWQLCWELSIDYEELAGETLTLKRNELIHLLKKHNRTSDLKRVVLEKYPDWFSKWLKWESVNSDEEE